jgi:hypothetical protein
VGPQQVDQFPLHDDAGAPRLHRAGDALVKARPAKGDPCAEPSDGTARDNDPERPLSS